ncbi:MAG: hypothetical protein EOO51_09000 [Flavobacterium sp.]|nr:MAG: hypothetical protein EOO51_09000 [Flavobacterium sp.]
MKIVKYSGEAVNFDKGKLTNSIIRAGASPESAADIVQSIESFLYPGITTRQIHKKAKQLLKRNSCAQAARYELRVGLQLLGPAGFFFEKFLARIFEKQGYECRTNIFLAGKCVAHEIDIALKKGTVITMAECKFHAARDKKSDVKVPLYVLSRFNDLKDVLQPIFSGSDTVTQCLIVTNTRFTTDASTFALCAGLELLSWDMPPGNAIKDMVDRGNDYPITCLTTITLIEKEKLMVSGVILVRELLDKLDTIERIGISPTRKNRIAREANELINNITI